jgi:class 3 adenylate cyclase
MIVNDVTEWLTGLGLERYAGAFVENDIDFGLLTSLDHEVLQAIGVKSAGHRMTMLKAAAALDGNEANATHPSFPRVVDDPRAATTEAEHRQLTVMFCDLADSTGLSGRLDAETYRDLILAYQQLCTRSVERYEGYVARFFGDGMLVYFGYPRAHEDETQRAIHAGIEILDGLGDLNSGEKNHDLNLAARIGIATGPVVVGDIIGDGASQESAVIGETPNVAARLQALAEMNRIVVSPATKNLAAGEFDFRSLGEHSLKGVEQPVVAWSVTGKRDHGSRFDSARGQQIAPLVGRDEERDILVRRWQRTADGSGQVVMISGEAGIGKSRLSRGLREQIRDQQHVELNYQCSPFHVSSALYPVINQLERAAAFRPGDDHETKLDKLEQLLGQSTDDIEASALLLADLLSLPGKHRYGEIDATPVQQKDKTLQLLVRHLEGLVRTQPVLMVFEDLHWADPTTLELLELMVEKIPGIRAMLLATHRPNFTPAWTGEAQVYSISLNKLDPGNCGALITSVSGGLSLPPGSA